MIYELIKNVESGKVHKSNTLVDYHHNHDDPWTCSICGNAIAGSRSNLLHPFEVYNSNSTEDVNCKNCIRLMKLSRWKKNDV